MTAVSVVGACTGRADLADVDAQFEQFAVDPRRSPKRILAAHSTDQLPHVFGDRRSARVAVPNFPCPEQPKALAAPGDDGFGLNDDQGRPPIVPNFAQPRPEESIG